ncbi:unnamed protein product [Brassica oleracea]|uniref:(rape) hypothetical protein n=1 Tax=Brassica napus TaxID=3708 RepID=A0A816HVS7_BRANA|nr:unnamed protein product [Brassica napus]
MTSSLSSNPVVAEERPAETSTDLTETTTEAPEKKVRKDQEPCPFQKNGTFAHVPPPTPKRKAAHPYPQKASKNAQMSLQVSMPFSTKISNVPDYTSWDDDTSALLSIVIMIHKS